MERDGRAGGLTDAAHRLDEVIEFIKGDDPDWDNAPSLQDVNRES